MPIKFCSDNYLSNKSKYSLFVSCTDLPMSYWGCAANRVSKLIVACETREQADTVFKKLANNRNYTYVTLFDKLPAFPTNIFHVRIKTYMECPAFH